MSIINLILFILPFVSAIFLYFNSQGEIILSGLFLIVATIFFFAFISPMEKVLSKMYSFNHLEILSYLTPIYYFFLVIISITLSWELINKTAIGDFWIFIFSFSCCYIPYNYMTQGEQATIGKSGILTNTVNNYSVIGYLLFGTLMNFTNIGSNWSYFLLVLLGLFLLNGLPKRLRQEVLSVIFDSLPKEMQDKRGTEKNSLTKNDDAKVTGSLIEMGNDENPDSFIEDEENIASQKKKDIDINKKNYCAKCNKLNSKTAKFCRSCGNKLKNNLK